MAIKIGINGFGRIGRLVYRAALESGAADVVAVNDLTDTKTLAHLLKYDSIHGTLKEDVEAGEGFIKVGKNKIIVSAERDPAAIKWGDAGADIVVESTGIFTDRDKAAKHLEGGTKKVIISAPGKKADATFVMGVNEKDYDPEKHTVVSNASCTTNCLAPVAKVLRDEFGIEYGLMTTIHSYTNDQPSQDSIHKDLRRARAAAVSMIPTTTGAARAISLVMPDLEGKLDGFAVRVPTPNVSLVDLTVTVNKSATVESVNAAMKKAAEGPLKGVLDYNELPLVSIDYNHTPVSSTVDGLSTAVSGDKLVKVLSWYDNEWGYSNRVVDLAKFMGGKL